MKHESSSSSSIPVQGTKDPNRRSVLMWLGAAGGVLGTLLAAVPVIGALFAPVIRKREDQWVDVGPVDDFPEGRMRLIHVLNPLRRPWDGASGTAGAYVRRTEGNRFHVFSTRCTHLGCPVTWFQQSGLFMCPCHGGVYYADGSKAAGPPPRGLYRLPHRVRSNRLEILLGHLPTLAEPA
jgi:menaquinol-cytochrome c reductase iron-sulfur subunit